MSYPWLPYICSRAHYHEPPSNYHVPQALLFFLQPLLCCPQQNKAFESFGVYNRGTRWAPTSYKLIRGVITPISGVNLPQLFSAIYRGPPHNSTYNWIPKRPAACPSSFGNISKSQHIHHAFEDLGGSPWPRFFAISRFRV